MGDEEIVLGIVVRGCGLEGSENMIGYCNNVLFIRSSINDFFIFL